MLQDSRMDSQAVAQCLFRSCRIRKSLQRFGIKSMMFRIDKADSLFLAGTVIGKLRFRFFRNTGVQGPFPVSLSVPEGFPALSL